MRLNSNIIISDTSCLILLLKINELELLRIFSNKVIVTSIIKEELKVDLPGYRGNGSQRQALSKHS
jgi:predicted nucleic acid-binding protein